MSARYAITVETDDRSLVFDMFDSRSMSAGHQIQITEGATLAWQGTRGYKAFALPEEVALLLTLASGVPVALVANWLWSRLRGRATTLRIDRLEIDIDEGEIRRVLSEKLEIEGS